MHGLGQSGQVSPSLIEAGRPWAAKSYALRVNPERPLYFPVKPEPLRMQAGLARFGTEFGNGEADRLFFPRDDQSPRYLAEKSRVLALHPERTRCSSAGQVEQRALAAAAEWLSRTLEREGLLAQSRLPLLELGRELVEDFAILLRSPDGLDDRVIFLHACFPSGWRPEHVIGKSFQQIHARIPGIAGVTQKSQSLALAMTERGPYVRFVWTISADDELDHHPAQGRRLAWSEHTARGFLRVERQTTVPLANDSASIFLIRTYLYGFDELSPEHRRTLSQALALMPPELARYKQLQSAIPRALQLLT
jgi:hypothetical protein